MASMKPSSRYPSFDSRSSATSQLSDPSSSAEFRNSRTNQSSMQHLSGKTNSYHQRPVLISGMENSNSSSNYSRVRTKSDLALTKVKQEQNLSSMVKKFMDIRSKHKGVSNQKTLVIPSDFVTEDVKKTATKGSKFTAFPRKLFQKGSSGSETKALTEVRSNTRTLAMVLRSERELLNQNKEYESEMEELKFIIAEKNREVEKLKDLCLNQREEIKALKSAILFPDVMNSQLQELLQQQGSELKQAKRVIPTLQEQVSSLTGQLQCLAVDLAEVKADKYATRGCYDGQIGSPQAREFDPEASNSVDYSSADLTTPGSPDDVFLEDLNPCLTPYYAKSKEFDGMIEYNSPIEEGLFGSDVQTSQENSFDTHSGKKCKSFEYRGRPSLGSTAARAARRSNENKCSYGKPMHHKLF